VIQEKSRKCRGFFRHAPLGDSELVFLHKEKPDIVYIWTGQLNDLPISLEALKILAKFTTIIRPTPEIMHFLAKEILSLCCDTSREMLKVFTNFFKVRICDILMMEWRY
jgi:hypothetical protein